MNDSRIFPSVPPSPAQLQGPREALAQFVAEVCRDLESSHTRLSAADSAEQLAAAATDAHKTLVGHGQTMGEFVQIVQNWRHDTL